MTQLAAKDEEIRHLKAKLEVRIEGGESLTSRSEIDSSKFHFKLAKNPLKPNFLDIFRKSSFSAIGK